MAHGHSAEKHLLVELVAQKQPSSPQGLTVGSDRQGELYLFGVGAAAEGSTGYRWEQSCG